MKFKALLVILLMTALTAVSGELPKSLIVSKIVGKPLVVDNHGRRQMKLYETVSLKTLIVMPYGSELCLFDEIGKQQYCVTSPGRATVSVLLKDKRNSVGQLTQQYVQTLLAKVNKSSSVKGVRVTDPATVTRDKEEADDDFDIDLNTDLDMDMNFDPWGFSKEELINEYRKFRKECMQTYANFVREAWDEYQGEAPKSMPEEKEQPPMIVPENDDDEPIVLDEAKLEELKGETISSEDETASWFSFLGKLVTKGSGKKSSKPKQLMTKDQQLAVEDVINSSVKDMKVPKALAPIAQVLGNGEKSIFKFSIFGTKYQVRVGDDCHFQVKGISENNVADALENLSDQKYDNLLFDCLKIRKENNLSDWAYYQLLKEMSEKFCGKNTDEATLLLAYVFSQSGYKIRLGRDAEKLVLLLASNHTIYNQVSYRIDGDRFYLLGNSAEHLNICRASFPNETDMRLTIPEAQQFDYEQSPLRTIKSRDYPEFKVTVHTNNNLMKFYDTYLTSCLNDELMTRWAMYANTPLAQDVKDELYPQFKSLLHGMSEHESVRRLLNWVQTGFVYEYDDKVWGGDRAFFAEETLYYPYCDCEDRSILLSRLVRDLLGLKAILIYYPGHLAMAVHFNEQVEGDYILHNNLRYIVCDPTYIGADVGRTMPRMDNSKARVILLQN